MDENIQKLVADTLMRHSEVQLAIVFGSAVTETMRKTSDVDVAVLA